MIAFPNAKKIAAMLGAVGEPTRMLILYRLTQGPHHVGQLADLLGVPMVNMSHHLGVMRQAGLLEDEKDGRRVVYRLRPDIYQPDGGESEAVGTLVLGAYRLVVLRAPAVDAAVKPKAKAKPKPKLARKGAAAAEPEAVAN